MGISDKIVNALKALEIKSTLDSEQDIVFKTELGNFFIDASDDNFLNIIFPSFHETKNKNQKQKAMLACNHVNETVKAVKVFMVKNQVYATIESFHSDEADLKGVIKHALAAFETAIAVFAEKIDKQPPVSE